MVKANCMREKIVDVSIQPLSALSREGQHSTLYVKQLPVESLYCQQPVMSAAFDDAPMIQHEDLIHTLHRQQAMRDLQGGTPPREFIQSVQQRALSQGIKVSGGFVEDEDGCVFQEGAGNRQALALAAGQLQTLLANPGFEPQGQLAHKLGELRLFHGCLDLRLAGSGPRQQQIGAQGVIENIGILGDDADQVAQVAQAVAADVLPVQANDATWWVPEAQREANQCAFAPATGADNRHAAAGAQVEADIAEHLTLTKVVSKMDMFE